MQLGVHFSLSKWARQRSLPVLLLVAISIMLLQKSILAEQTVVDDGVSTAPLRPWLMPRRISVILPCFNCEEFVAETIDSIIESIRALDESLEKQSFRKIPVEVVVVDDGSTDGSMDLLSSIVKRQQNRIGYDSVNLSSVIEGSHHSFRLLEMPENKGAGAARNFGVKKATGDVIAFAESDDWLLPNHLAVCIHTMLANRNLAFVKTKIDMGEGIHPHWQLGVEDVSPLNTCIRKEAFVFSGGFPESELFKEDMEDGHLAMVYHAVYRGAKSYLTTTKYRRRPGNSLDKRMHQFTNPPGTVPLIQMDIDRSEERMQKIEVETHLARDRLAEYQDVHELLKMDPLAEETQEAHAERSARFLSPSLAVPRAAYAPLKVFTFVSGLIGPRNLHSILAHLVYEQQRNPFDIGVAFEVIPVPPAPPLISDACYAAQSSSGTACDSNVAPAQLDDYNREEIEALSVASAFPVNLIQRELHSPMTSCLESIFRTPVQHYVAEYIGFEQISDADAQDLAGRQSTPCLKTSVSASAAADVSCVAFKPALRQ